MVCRLVGRHSQPVYHRTRGLDVLSAIVLTCASVTPLFPALALGASFTFDGRHFHCRPTRQTFRTVCAALADGSVVTDQPPDPLYDELERRIMADRDALFAKAEALLAQAPAAHLLRAG